jgi:hypothetical protein
MRFNRGFIDLLYGATYHVCARKNTRKSVKAARTSPHAVATGKTIGEIDALATQLMAWLRGTFAWDHRRRDFLQRPEFAPDGRRRKWHRELRWERRREQRR